jgi:hypothetical protein
MLCCAVYGIDRDKEKIKVEDHKVKMEGESEDEFVNKVKEKALN